MVFYLAALLIAAADQLIKLAAQHFLAGRSIPLLGPLKLTYIQNTGAAFSIFTGFSNYLAIIGVIVVLLIIYFQRQPAARDFWLQTGLALVLGGSLGNLVDRICRGYVIDYLDLTYWPVFNLADMMIDLGVLLIVVKYLFKGDQKDASRPV